MPIYLSINFEIKKYYQVLDLLTSCYVDLFSEMIMRKMKK